MFSIHLFFYVLKVNCIDKIWCLKDWDVLKFTFNTCLILCSYYFITLYLFLCLYMLWYRFTSCFIMPFNRSYQQCLCCWFCLILICFNSIQELCTWCRFILIFINVYTMNFQIFHKRRENNTSFCVNLSSIRQLL